MTPNDLQQYIETNAIPAEVISLTDPTPTVETAAEAVGAHTDQIIKSLLFLVAGEPVLAIACGTRQVDYRRIADHRGIGRRQVKMADAETVEKVTGYPAGGVPPFGHPQPIETLIDPEVLTQPFIFGGGGDDHSLVRMDPAALQEITNAMVVPLLKP